MSGYIIPQSVKNDFEAFKKHYNDFLSGKLDDITFKTIRVPFGIYEQREANTYMARIKLSGGVISPKQLFELANLSERYANGVLHVTTRGGAQLHYLNIKDFLIVIEAIHSIGLTGRGGGGNTVRNITADPYAGVAQDEAFDVTPHTIALTEKMLEQKDSYSLPRKFKLSFSGSSADRGGATFIDVGFIAKIQNGKKGFRVFVGGGMGAKSRVGQSFIDFLPENEIFVLSQAIKEVFDEKGNRKNKHSARLRFLIEDIGLDEFRELVDKKIAALKAKGDWEIELQELPQAASINDEISANLSGEERIWWDRYSLPQKQKGYFSVKVPLFLGDLPSQKAKDLALKLSDIAQNRDVLRFGSDQNIYLRNLTQSELLKLYPILKEISPLVLKPTIIGDAVVCTGAATCQLGITIPRGALKAIEKTLIQKNAQLDELTGFKIHMSGCPNSCGKHSVADLGFFGKVLRKGDAPYPAYNIVAGAKIWEDKTSFAKKIADISAYHLPSFTAELLQSWIEIKKDYQSFAHWVDDKGADFIADLAAKYSSVPSFDEDKNPYYDYTAKEVFSLAKRGAGECSAGMYDLIEADKKALAAALKTEPNDLKAIRHLASRMLLVTRGEEARDEKEVLEAFKKSFIDVGLINKKFAKLLEGEATAEVVELAKEVINLYASMDNSLKFSVQTEQKAAEKTNEAKNSSDKFKDYRGVACPMNFVKTKMDLSQMQSGEILEILLDDGAPIENVPKSVAGEGHKIESQQKEGASWRVKIRKK